MTGKAYFFVYRQKVGHYTCYQEPTGGLEMDAKIVDGELAPDYKLAFCVITERYHCAPGESLVFREVYSAEDQWTAHLLHQAWERDMREFQELMDCA